MNEMAPCPFCGRSSNELTISVHLIDFEVCYPDHYPRYTSYYFTQAPIYPSRVAVINASCKCGCSFEKKVASKEDFIKAWNTRAKKSKKCSSHADVCRCMEGGR